MNILHLSDIHFGRNYDRYGLAEKFGDKFDNKEKILSDLIKCIGGLGDFRPEHIVVTGDIAWHGKRDEYEEAQVWFQKLLKAVDLEGKDITFCPGNHDVNRSFSNLHIEYQNDSIKEIDDVYDYENIHVLEPPFYEYDRFCEDIGMEPFAYPYQGKIEYSYGIGYKDVKFASGNTIRIVAFNTALLSFSSVISEDKMWIGQKQIYSLMKYGIIPSKDVYYTIALFHHAERYLHLNEICEFDGRVATLNLLRENVDLVLCGHTETGGRPVLHQQIGGAKLLTAGAAYYNDTHPNAFSLLCIPDNKKTVCVCPFIYKDGWKKYDIQGKSKSFQKLYDLPSLGDIKAKCRFVVKTDKEEFIIPLKIISVYSYMKDGVEYIKIDNKKEVLRYLDIKCEKPVNGDKMDVSVKLAPKMERSVRAMRMREEYFLFLDKNMKDNNFIEFYVENDEGIKFVYANGIQGESEADEVSVDILKKMEKIEDHFNIRFYLPDQIYERDLERIDLLIELIENGFTTKISLNKIVSTSFYDNKKLQELYKKAKKNNAFTLKCKDSFWCHLFDVKFCLKNVAISTGKYRIDMKNVKYKIDTFMEGDTREVIFAAEDGYLTYFIIDEKKARYNALEEQERDVIWIKKMGLKWDFISEEE